MRTCAIFEWTEGGTINVPQDYFGEDIKIISLRAADRKVVLILEGKNPPGVPLNKEDADERKTILSKK